MVQPFSTHGRVPSWKHIFFVWSRFNIIARNSEVNVRCTTAYTKFNFRAFKQVVTGTIGNKPRRP